MVAVQLILAPIDSCVMWPANCCHINPHIDSNHPIKGESQFRPIMTSLPLPVEVVSMIVHLDLSQILRGEQPSFNRDEIDIRLSQYQRRTTQLSTISPLFCEAVQNALTRQLEAHRDCTAGMKDFIDSLQSQLSPQQYDDFMRQVNGIGLAVQTRDIGRLVDTPAEQDPPALGEPRKPGGFLHPGHLKPFQRFVNRESLSCKMVLTLREQCHDRSKSWQRRELRNTQDGALL